MFDLGILNRRRSKGFPTTTFCRQTIFSKPFVLSLFLFVCLFGCSSASQWFRSAVIKENAMPEGLMTLLFSNIDPIYEFHRGFLKELDQRLALW